MSVQSAHRFTRAAAYAALSLLLSVIPVLSQDNPQVEPKQSAEGLFSRILRGNYTPPTIHNLEGAQDSFQSMIRDGKLDLSEADAVRLALENNVDINVERYNPYFNLWGIKKGRAVLDPFVRYNSNLNRLVTPTVSVLQGADTLFNLDTLYEMTIHKPFERGLDLDLTFNSTRARSSNFFLSLNPSLFSGLNLTLTQHLLKDLGGIARGRFLRIARNNYSMSEEEFRNRTSDIIVNVLNSYWDLVFNREEIAVKELSKKLAEVVVSQNKIQVEQGTLALLDVVQAESESATRNEQLVVARYNRRLAEDQLKRLISSQLDPGAVAAEVEPSSLSDVPPALTEDVSQAIRRALEIRPEVRQLLLDQENKQIQVDYTRNQLRPVLDLVASYSQNGVGGTRITRDYSFGIFDAPVIATERGGFWDSLNSFFSRRYLGYTVGFTVQVPLRNDEARANNAQAQIAYKQGAERLRSLRQKIALEVREAYERMEMNQGRLNAAGVTVRFAQRRLEAEQDKYSLGSTTSRFVLEAQRDLADAQSRLVKAKIDLIKSRIAVRKATGEIFTAYNIEVKEALRLFK